MYLAVTRQHKAGRMPYNYLQWLTHIKCASLSQHELSATREDVIPEHIDWRSIWH